MYCLYYKHKSFIKYDNEHYTICKEDDLQYHILVLYLNINAIIVEA